MAVLKGESGVGARSRLLGENKSGKRLEKKTAIRDESDIDRWLRLVLKLQTPEKTGKDAVKDREILNFSNPYRSALIRKGGSNTEAL